MLRGQATRIDEDRASREGLSPIAGGSNGVEVYHGFEGDSDDRTDRKAARQVRRTLGLSEPERKK